MSFFSFSKMMIFFCFWFFQMLLSEGICFNCFVLMSFFPPRRRIDRWFCIQRPTSRAYRWITNSISNICLSGKISSRISWTTTTCATSVVCSSWRIWRMLSQTLFCPWIKKLLQEKLNLFTSCIICVFSLISFVWTPIRFLFFSITIIGFNVYENPEIKKNNCIRKTNSV